jgi:hypothetical protein
MNILTLFQSFNFNPLRWKIENLRTALVIALAVLVMGLTISDAKQRGLHHRVMVSPSEQTAIAIALSETVYGLNLGYVGYRNVFNTLQAYWNKGDPSLWSDYSILTKNFGDKQLLNEGIQAAATLGPQKAGYFTDGSLITTIYDDQGEVDFYKIAFKLFGMKIQSAFYLFFLLLGMSAIVFILTFRNNVYALCALLCTLLGFYQELNLAVFDQIAGPTFFGMRHSSTLGLIPMWYFSFLLVFPRKLSVKIFAGAVLQTAILILAFRIRGSVAWVFIFLFLLTSFLVLVRSWPKGLKGLGTWMTPIRSWAAWGQTWPILLRDTLCWPIMVLIFALLANATYSQISRHLIYSTDDVIPYHGVWWTGVNALYFDRPQVFEDRVKNTGGTPEGWWHLRDYYDRIRLIPWDGAYEMTNNPPSILSPWTSGQLKYRLVDDTMKKIYVEAFTKKPLVSAEYYLIEQPKHITRQLLLPFKNANGNKWLWMTFLGSILTFSLTLLLNDKKSSSPPDKIILLSLGAFLISWLPGLWAYSQAATIPDAILLFVSSIPLIIGLGAYWIYRYLRQAWSQ